MLILSPRDRSKQFTKGVKGVVPPNCEPGPLLDTYERWLQEGLSPDLDPRRYDEWCEAFGLDYWPRSIVYRCGSASLYEETILEETASTVVKRLANGAIREENKGSHGCIPHELRPAITTHAEWERYKQWMALETPLPVADDSQIQKFRQLCTNETQCLIMLAAGSLVGVIRDLLGFEAFVTMVYDDRDWLDDMFEAFCRAAEWQIRACGENGIQIDGIHFWEDICYKNGPMMNPLHFHEMVVPRYRRIANLAGHYGYDNIDVDSDGDITALIDGWIEGEVTSFCPLEVQAGMDINILQRKYSGKVIFTGGIHKHRLTDGPAAIAKELERVRPAVEHGGYSPMLDHNVPADVSLQNYVTYLKLRHDILGLGHNGTELNRLKNLYGI